MDPLPFPPDELQGAVAVHESLRAVRLYRKLPAGHPAAVFSDVLRAPPIVVVVVANVAHGGCLDLHVHIIGARHFC